MTEQGIMILIGIAVLLILWGLYMVKQQTAVIIERFGKFRRISHAGLHIRIPFVDRMAARLSLRIQQLDVMVETKTLDDVFVQINVSVQYQVMKDSIYNAFYMLATPTDQIRSYVFDTVRAEVPKMKVDDVFEKKDDIAIAIKRELSEAMHEYGYTIIKTLVTDIDPAAEVKSAMNRINAAERQKIAAEYEGEAEKIRIVFKATAEAESKRLQGKGIADQRREIAKGLEDSVEALNKVGINSQEASSLIVITQHYDTLHSMSENANSNMILLPNSPSTASDMLTDMVKSLTIAANVNETVEQANLRARQQPPADEEL